MVLSINLVQVAPGRMYCKVNYMFSVSNEYILFPEAPIILWEASTEGAAIVRVLWSRSCSYIIFVLDENSTVHMWDLLRNDAEPMTSDMLSQGGRR